MRLDNYKNADGIAVLAAKILDVDIPREKLTIILKDNTTEELNGLSPTVFFTPPNNPNVGDYLTVADGEEYNHWTKDLFEEIFPTTQPSVADTATTATETAGTTETQS